MNRRTFLQTAAALAVAPLQAAAAAPASRVIDTHTHFYDPSRKQGVPWPQKNSPLHRTVLPKDWLAVASPVGVRETIVVEASAWLEDNAWILELAAQEKCIVGFIGHLSPEEAGFQQHVKRFGANPIFRGIRVSQRDFLAHEGAPAFRESLTLLADEDLTLEVNGSTAVHAPVAKLAESMPSLRIVVDHVGGAGDAARLSAEWRSGMAALGKRPKVYCKVSALMEQTDAARREWGTAPRDPAYYTPILDHCRESFGEDRLIYGSNWPVCERGGSYADQFRIVTEYFGALGRDASEKYFWKNATAAYL